MHSSPRQAAGDSAKVWLKNVFNVAIEWGKTKHNPVRGIKQFKENHRIRFLSDEQEDRLEEVFPAKDWSSVEIAIHTGMRRSEQFHLRWENVDFSTRTLTIPRSKHGEVRYIDMNDKVVEILRSLPSRLVSPWVFPSATGESAMDAQNFVNRVFKPAVDKAGLGDFRWHDLRHTFISRLVMKGVDLRTVQELAGHKTITMTLRYSHLAPSHKKEAVQCLLKNGTDTKTDTGQKKNSSNSA
jgi:integrase